ncbi:MAG: DUF4340 domain-containing protein [Gammaproteobacteria bacterium]|nr:DUF4340 domain-containing protein [Gammaproteobacteria bacterium]
MSRNWINAVLLVLVLGLASLIWLPEPVEPDIQFTPLTPLQPGQISSIRIENQNGPAFSMQRERDSWRMSVPYAIAANEARIERLLKILLSPVHTHFKAGQHELAEFGLAPPKAHLHLDQLEIRIGTTDPINHYRYIAIGNVLYLIKDLFPHLLLASAESYVSPRILPANNDVESIKTPSWQLTHQPSSTQVWQLEPVVNGISMDRLTEKVAEWKNAQALKVIKAPGNSFETTLEIRLNGSTAPLIFGILRQQQGILLVSQQLGLAYDLPRIESLLSLPSKQPKVP